MKIDRKECLTFLLLMVMLIIFTSCEERTLLPFEENGKYGLASSSGKQITKPVYDHIGNFYDGIARVEVDGKFGYINNKGIEVVSPKYEWAYYKNGRFIVITNYLNYSILDNKGNLIEEPDEYEACFRFYQFDLNRSDSKYGPGMFCQLYNSEGFEVIDTTGRGPLNNHMSFWDPQGRLLVIAGRASESDEYNAVRFLYGEDGGVRGLLSLNGGWQCCNIDDMIGGKQFEEEYGSYYSIFCEKCSVYDLALYTDENKLYYDRFYFDRDEKGRIIKVYDPVLYHSISAPWDSHFEYLVRENENFWGSDIVGGDIDLLFITTPNTYDEFFEPDTFYYYSHSMPKFD